MENIYFLKKEVVEETIDFNGLNEGYVETFIFITDDIDLTIKDIINNFKQGKFGILYENITNNIAKISVSVSYPF